MWTTQTFCKAEKDQKTIAIVGFGLSGVSLFCQLVDKLIQNIETSKSNYKIKIFEKNESYFATGQPYQTNSPQIWTLNNSASKLKLLPNGMDMATWMKENKIKWEKDFPNINEDYPPRALVGNYLKDQYLLYKEKANSHGIMVDHPDFAEIIDMTYRENDTWQLVNKNQEKYEVDSVFLCLGHVLSNQYTHLKDKPNYFHFEDSMDKLKDIPKNESVYIIGGQATFVDITLWLSYFNHHVGDIYTVTRNSPIITTKGNSDSCDKEPLNALKENLKTNYQPNSISLSEGKILFWDTYKRAAKIPINIDMLPTTHKALTYQLAKYDGCPQNNNVTGNIDELRSFIFTFYFSGCYREFWEKLKDEDKNEFNKQLSSHIFAYLTGITPMNARLLLALYDNNQIHELSGLTHITFDDTKQKFLLHFKDGKINECTYLIDSSGLGYDVSKSHSNFPLLNNLKSHGYLVPRRHGGILLNDFGQMINKDNQVQQSLFCIGPIASYGHPIPTPYASFIAIDAVEKALMALSRNLLLGDEVNLSEFKVAR